MKIYIILIMTGLCLFSLGIKAQNIQLVDIDSTRNAEGNPVYPAVDTMNFKPNSTKAVLFSALVPGLGQAYNRKYWKLPLVYGSFIGCFYAITWNNSQYTGYKKAFIDFSETNEKLENAGTSWQNYAPFAYPENLDEWTADQKSQFSTRLKSSKDYYRYYRDMSWIITIGVYAVWMIDAYVDAQLFDFDVSPDLSMRAAPAIFDKTPFNSRSFGLQLCFTF